MGDPITGPPLSRRCLIIAPVLGLNLLATGEDKPALKSFGTNNQMLRPNMKAFHEREVGLVAAVRALEIF
jgi:hypothetical protein